MKEMIDAEQLFSEEIQALWSAESMLTESMPGMIGKANHPALKKSLAFHLAETEQHKVALEMICKQLGFNPDGDINQEMKEILEGNEKELNNDAIDVRMDTLLIEGAKKVEAAEISGYQHAAASAESLGHSAIASRLRLTMEEEQQAEGKLKFLEKEVIDKKQRMAVS